MNLYNIDYDEIYNIMSSIQPSYSMEDVDKMLSNARVFRTLYILLSNDEGHIIIDDDYTVIEAKFDDVEYKVSEWCSIDLNTPLGLIKGYYNSDGILYYKWPSDEEPLNWQYNDETGELCLIIGDDD